MYNSTAHSYVERVRGGGGRSEQGGNGTARTLTTQKAGAITGPAGIEGTHLIASKVPKGHVQSVGLSATACYSTLTWLELRAMRPLQRSPETGISALYSNYSVMYTM